MDEIKVEGQPDLVKKGAVVLNNNKSAFMNFIENRANVQKKNQEHDELLDRVAQLEALVASLATQK